MADDSNWTEGLPAAPLDDGTEVKRLAALAPLAYDRARAGAAAALGVSVTALDAAVRDHRTQAEVNKAADDFEDVAPWPDRVDGAALLDEIRQIVDRFCVLPEHSAPLIAAWVVHSWAHSASDVSPILAFTSPQKRCGKTTAMKVISALVPKKLHSVNISTSVMFRVIEEHSPTVLIDEADTFLAANEDLRGILNGGHDRMSAYVWRSDGDTHKPTRFSVWAPKCIAMIGSLPDTLEDRALLVELRRKAKGEDRERFRSKLALSFYPVKQRAARWALDHHAALFDADPVLPDSLNDRAQDNARAIVAIADEAGGHWPKLVRDALVGIASVLDVDDPSDDGAALLKDIVAIMDQSDARSMSSTDLALKLSHLVDAPWSEFNRGHPISPRAVAILLKPYRIQPRRDRYGSVYHRRDFDDAVHRYLSASIENSTTSASSATGNASVIKKSNENKGLLHCGSCGGVLEGGRCKCNGGAHPYRHPPIEPDDIADFH